MGRRHWSDGQEIVVEDLNSATYAIERQLYERVIYQMLQRKTDSFFGDSFRVLYASPNSVLITSGLGFLEDSAQASPQSKIRPLFLSSNATENIETPDASNDRIDIVCVRSGIVDELSGSRKVKDASSSVITTESLTVQKDWLAEILIVAGTPNAVPVVPSTPAGYIKIAELAVTAVSGLSGSGAVTDTRDLLPSGGLGLVNTTGADRLTSSTEESIQDLFLEVDAFLKNGDFEFLDVEELASVPAAPSAGKQRIYLKDDVLYRRESGGDIIPVGAGGGGGGALKWTGPDGEAPLEIQENGENVFAFSKGDDQTLVAFVKVPSSFIAGRQITMQIGLYSPAAVNEFEMTLTTTLVRKNVDAITSVTNQNTDNTGDIENTLANQYRTAILELTTSLGTINSLQVQGGDLLKLELTRSAPSGTDDDEDVRFVPSSTEIIFG